MNSVHNQSVSWNPESKEGMMSQNTCEDRSEHTAPSLLQSRPQRKARWRKRRTFSTVLLGVAAVIIVGTGIVLAAVLIPHGSSPTKNASTTKNVTPVTGNNSVASTKGKNTCGATVYWDTLFQQTAQGLHLSVAQAKAQIKGGKSIQDVASEQGISAQQLQNIEISALQAANNQLVAMKCQSQDQADARVQYYTSQGPQEMNLNFTRWFANL
jgi:hypothetical protein